MSATQQGFVEFVNAQDSDRKIDHESWGTCAVGEYLETVNTDITPHCFANDILDVEIMDALGGDMPPSVDTYGELQEFLEEHLTEVAA